MTNNTKHTISGHSIKDTASLMLFQVWKNFYPKSTVKQTDTGLEFNGTTISITPVIENQMEKDGKFFEGIRFEISLNGKMLHGLTFGSVGIDDSLENADKTAIQEWAMGFGLPVIDALENAEERSTTIDGITFHNSLMSIRGMGQEKPGGWVDGTKKMNEKILQAAMPILKKESAGSDYTSMQMLIAVKPKEPLEAQCRLDGLESAELTSAMTKLDWPKEKGYMFKQCYVFKNKSE